MARVQLALYKAPGLVGNAVIRWWTRSQYSHCELVVDGWCHSSSLRDGGVRRKLVELDPEHWDFIVLPDHLVLRVLQHFALTQGQAYGWFDLLRSQVLNTADDEPGAAFCSEWCAAALGLPNPTTYSPRTLADTVQFILGAPWQQAA